MRDEAKAGKVKAFIEGVEAMTGASRTKTAAHELATRAVVGLCAELASTFHIGVPGDIGYDTWIVEVEIDGRRFEIMTREVGK